MCCSHRLISRIPTTPPPVLTPRNHFPTRPTIHIPLATGSARSFKTRATVKDGGATVANTVMDDLSFYQLLGIPDTVTSVEIKQAYKQLARKYHPDVSPPGRVEEYTQRFIRVQEAYETLSDPNRRALYDRDMAMGMGMGFRFGFPSRNRVSSDEKIKEKSEWRGLWQGQLSELKRRSMHKESGKNASWAARMRSQRNESPS